MAASEERDDTGDDEPLEVLPVVVVSQAFPARPSSIPDIRDFVRRWLERSPLTAEDKAGVGATVSQALLDAAGPDGSIQVSFRISPDGVEVDVLREPSAEPREEDVAAWLAGGPIPRDRGAEHVPALPREVPAPEAGSFSEWMAEVLHREGLTMEAAARQLGVSVRTVSRWVGGTTEPRLRDLRRISEIFGPVPFS